MSYKWRTVVIGAGAEPFPSYYMTSGRKVDGYNTISENEDSFWIHNVFFNRGMTVYKDTDLGKIIEADVSIKQNEDFIKNYLQSHFIENIPPDKLIKIVNEAVEDAFKQGQDAKIAEVRTVLGL